MNPPAYQPDDSPRSVATSPAFSAFPPRIEVPYHELLRCIGRGSYGEVWLARHVLGWYRAIKIVYKHTFEEARPFAREFEGIKHFEPVSRSHPSQLAVMEVGLSPNGSYFFYAMELADDASSELELNPQSYSPKTLKSVLGREGRIAAKECFKIGISLGTALEHLHAHQLVHRDIKPSNIIFVGGVPKLADIGLVASVDATVSLVGTMGYFPPEGPGTQTADLYSLGKVLYEMSTGRHRNEFPKLPENLEECEDADAIVRLNTIVLKACHHDPAQRYESATQMRRDLEAASQGKKKLSPLVRSKRAVLIPIVLLIIALALSILIQHFQSKINSAAAEKFAQNSQAGCATLPHDVVIVPWPNDRSDNFTWRTITVLVDSLQMAGLRVPQTKMVWVAPSTNQPFTNVPARYSLTLRAKSPGDGVFVCSFAAFREQQLVASGDFEEKTGEEFLVGFAQKIASLLDAKTAGDWSENVRRLAVRKYESFRIAGEAWQQFMGSSLMKDLPIGMYHRAIELDNNNLYAYLALAQMYRECVDWNRPAAIAWPEVRTWANAALQIDDTHSWTWMHLAGVTAFYDWNWKEGERLFQKEISLAPPGRWHGSYSVFLRARGRRDEARVIAEYGLRLNPKDGFIRSVMIPQLWQDGKYLELEQFLRDGLQLNPNWHLYHAILAALYIVELDRPEDALREIELARDVEESPRLMATRIKIYARLDRAKAEEQFRKLEEVARSHPYVSPYVFAHAHMALGNIEEALQHLEKALEDRCEALVNADKGGLLEKAWRPLRDNPRFRKLIHAVGFDDHPDWIAYLQENQEKPVSTH